MSTVFANIDNDGVVLSWTRYRANEDQVEMLESEVATNAATNLVAAKRNKRNEILCTFNQYGAQVIGEYPDGERLSWAKQESEAKAHKANANANVPLIAQMAGQRGLTIADLALRIRKNVAAQEYAGGVLIGERQRCEDALTVATTVAQVQAITFTLPADFYTNMQAAHAAAD